MRLESKYSVMQFPQLQQLHKGKGLTMKITTPTHSSDHVHLVVLATPTSSPDRVHLGLRGETEYLG